MILKEEHMLRVVHFELAADDPERAVKFYSDIFGWKIEKWAGPVDYWLITTGKDEPGIDGALGRRGEIMEGANTINVPSVDEYISKIEASGGKVVAPKNTVPGVGYVAYCQDTEGATFGIIEEDTSAQ
jgi:predicted enzyme related to lactoylglutathione lyase